MCMTPITITIPRTNEQVAVPCGKCPLCLARRISGWSFRLMEEDRVSTSSQFITLTYDTKTVPITKAGFMSLSKEHLQLYFKRVRKAHPVDIRLKYYVCGEYGEESYRPHYHLLLFNALPDTAQALWDKGDTFTGSVTGASVGYTLKYMCKARRIPLHRNDDRLPEFSLMSKKLGASYLKPNMIAWHQANLLDRMYINIGDGKKAAMPRYYKNKIYDQEQRNIIAGHHKGQHEVETINAISEYSGNASYAWEKNQAVKAAYQNMYHSNKLRQTSQN